ncbi:hypothetical protein H4582DRAFT_1350456 [Lactarius indigo]|nr:hypothetical protein H4582DRAFT_1350456 [Lactarius indigo]
MSTILYARIVFGVSLTTELVSPISDIDFIVWTVFGTRLQSTRCVWYYNAWPTFVTRKTQPNTWYFSWFEFHQVRGFVLCQPHCATPIPTLYLSFKYRLAFLSFKMITPDSVQQVNAVLHLNNTSTQVVEARASPPMGRGRHSSTRAASSYQNLPYTYPRIPRPVTRQGNTPRVALDSQFQVNASHVQKPLSLVSNENRERGILVSPTRCSLGPEDVKWVFSSSPLFGTSHIPADLKAVGYEVVV